jgi:zinc/manganese transport system substrate-binding protein
VLAPFHYAFVQRGVLEIALLSIAAGLLGTWIVLRGLAFYSHAVGTAAFPGLVLADGLAFPAGLGAFAAAVVFAFGVERLARDRQRGHDTATALVLVAALALGVILASDVFHSRSNVETLLFGSLLLVSGGDLVLAAVTSAVVLATSFALGRRWLARGFDETSARSPVPDAVLLLLIALAVTASLDAIGALLVSSLLVVPAATVRLVARRLVPWQVVSILLTAAEGVAGLWLSVQLNVPPGAAIAMLASGVFALVAAWRAAPRVHRSVPAAAALLVLAGCGSDGGSSGLSVVATTTQIGDWVREVGGANVRMHQILQPNTDPHEYEPRPADVQAAAGAKIVFENGDGLDAWAGKIVDQAGGKPAVVVLGERVPVRRSGERAGPEASRYDPHWWHDPRNAEAAVAAIRDALADADRGHARTYERNAARYLSRVRALDRGIAACFADVPRADRKLVTDHDAFGYFAARYGLHVIGAVIPSQTTQAQPSAGETAKLIALIRREHVRAVFPESSVNARLARTIARETGAGARLTLYGDTLGPARSSGSTYLAMEAANADAIVRGLTGGRSGCSPGGGS